MENVALIEVLNFVPMMALMVSVFTYYQSVKERHYKEAEESVEVDKKLEKLDEQIGKIEKIQDYLDNDNRRLDNHARSIGDLANNQKIITESIARNAEGIYLCMQHEVKGNHTELLEKWMRQSAKETIQSTESIREEEL